MPACAAPAQSLIVRADTRARGRLMRQVEHGNTGSSAVMLTKGRVEVDTFLVAQPTQINAPNRDVWTVCIWDRSSIG